MSARAERLAVQILVFEGTTFEVAKRFERAIDEFVKDAVDAERRATTTLYERARHREGAMLPRTRRGSMVLRGALRAAHRGAVVKRMDRALENGVEAYARALKNEAKELARRVRRHMGRGHAHVAFRLEQRRTTILAVLSALAVEGAIAELRAMRKAAA